MNFVLPLTAALVAILILPGASFYFDVAPKSAVVLIGAALAVNLLKRDRFSMLLGVSAAATILAAAFSTNPWMSFNGSTWRRDGVVVEIAIFVLAAAVGAPRDLLRFVTFASIPVAIYAILQYFGIDPILASAGYHFGTGEFTIVRPPSTLGHAAYLATFLLFAVFAAVAEKSRWRWVPISLAVFAILLSGTRAAILGLIAGAALVAIRQTAGFSPRKASALLIAGIAALAIFYVSPPGAKLRARVHWSGEDSLGGARLPLWRDTLLMAAHRPILGYGPETFSREFLKSESLDLERAYPDFYHESPHNIFLDALVSKGILGLIPLFAIAALALARARGPMGGAFVAMLVSQQFTTFTIPTELFFYLSAGLLLRDAAPTARWKLWPLGLPFFAFAIYLSTGDALLAAAQTGAGSWRSIDGDPTDRPRAALERFGRRVFFAPPFGSEEFRGVADCAQLRRARAPDGGRSAERAAESGSAPGRRQRCAGGRTEPAPRHRRRARLV